MNPPHYNICLASLPFCPAAPPSSWGLSHPSSSFPWELLVLMPSSPQLRVSHPGRMQMDRLLTVPRDHSRQCSVLTGISTAQPPSLPERHAARLPAPCPQEVSQ